MEQPGWRNSASIRAPAMQPEHLSKDARAVEPLQNTRLTLIRVLARFHSLPNWQSTRARLKQTIDSVLPYLFRVKEKATWYRETRSDIHKFLSSCQYAFWALAAFSGLSNLLMLTGSFFMLQVYDRVLPSRSLPTLVGLLILATILYLFQGGLDLVRSRICARMGRFLEETLGMRVYDAVMRLPLKTRTDGDGLQPLRDVDRVRSFFSNGGPVALFDLPWIPLYLGICFYFHFWIGTAALAGTIVLIGLTVLAHIQTRDATRAMAEFASTRNAIAAEGRRNAEVLTAMGMRQWSAERWYDADRSYMLANEASTDVASRLGGISKIFRLFFQSGVLAVGAYLVINQQATGGIIIAASILTSRALAPVESAIAQWSSFVAARQATQRLNVLLDLLPEDADRMELPVPSRSFSVDGLRIAAPASDRAILQNVSFRLVSGDGLGIIGPSGSGKSSLARALVGVWPQAHGKIRIDDAALDQWMPERLGRHIGFMPQDVQLFDGNVAANIARFDSNATPAAVLAATDVTGVHELILSLPNGYGTLIGESGMSLSAGQRQRIALARAFYGDPFLIVLDEPSSNLDSDGEAALNKAILSVRQRGGIVIVITHRPLSLESVEKVLVCGNGIVQAFGDKEEVLRKVLRNPVPLRMAASEGRLR